MLTLDKRRAEEDEGIGWTWDIPRAFPAPRLRSIVPKWFIFWREDVGGRRMKGWRGILRESSGCNIGCELDCLRGGLYGRGPFQIET